MRALVLFALLFLVGCGDTLLSPINATNFLEQQDYTEIETTGGRAAFCGRLGPGAVGFKAKNPRGHIVTGAVCENWNGGKVIALD